jgi:hypothetical protein
MSKCNVKIVGHNEDGICKIASPVFCFLVESPTSGVLNNIHQVTSERQRCPDVVLIGRCKECRSTGGGVSQSS